jgi:tetratricopeptide (TPR) repeat protein
MAKAKSAHDYKAIDKLLTGDVSRKKTDEAIALLDKILAKDPNDVGSLTRVAKAWIRQLEVETGTVLVEKKEYQKTLDECGKKALKAAERAHDLDPESPDAIGWHLVSYGYHAVAIGIVAAFLRGAAGKYLELADNIINAEPEWHSGAGHRAMGRFYRESPWPKRDVKKAIKCFRESLELAPKRQENKLHLALALIDNGEKAEAKKLLAEVVKGKPEATEAHFHDHVVAFAQEKLAEI